MAHWGAVLTSAAPGIKERPPPSKVGPASRLDQCRLLSEIKLPRNEKNDDIDQKNVHPNARTKGTVKKMFFPAYPKKCVNVLDRISRQRQLLIKKMTFITQRK